MKLETVLKVIEIIRRSGDEYFETYSVKFHILVSINFQTHNCHILYRITVYCMHTFIFYVQI